MTQQVHDRPAVEPAPPVGRSSDGPAEDVPRRRHLVGAVGGAILLLVAVTLVYRLGPAHAGLFAGPVCAAALVILARRCGLSWEDLGLARRSWRTGTAYGIAAVAVVAGVYAVAAAFPVTRAAFLDARYHLPAVQALVSAFVVIPIATVLLEEVAFRGVILGLVRRHHGVRWAAGFSSVLFGLWHILPSLRLGTVNPAVAAVFGSGALGQVVIVAAAVAFTGGAGLLFCELRRRSGSLLAAAGLHWATNGLGVVVALVLWNLPPS